MASHGVVATGWQAPEAAATDGPLVTAAAVAALEATERTVRRYTRPPSAPFLASGCRRRRAPLYLLSRTRSPRRSRRAPRPPARRRCRTASTPSCLRHTSRTATCTSPARGVRAPRVGDAHCGRPLVAAVARPCSPSARLAWKRIAETPALAQEPQTAAVYAIVQALWRRDYAAALAAFQGFAWSAAVDASLQTALGTPAFSGCPAGSPPRRLRLLTPAALPACSYLRSAVARPDAGVAGAHLRHGLRAEPCGTAHAAPRRGRGVYGAGRATRRARLRSARSHTALLGLRCFS